VRHAVLALLLTAIGAGVRGQSARTLDIYAIDVEGGQATLVVSPSGESMLIDAGWPGFEGRDADRIAATAKQAGLSRIDYLVVSHYHRDHVGGVPELIRRMPVRNFVDHGASVEQDAAAAALFDGYVAARKTGTHLQVEAGDAIPIGGIDVRVVAADGQLLTRAIGDGGRPNPLCHQFTARDADASENARSVGLAIAHGQFRLLDLSDLTWNKERDLVCPNNVLGTFDVYVSTHHGMDASGPAVLVHAIRPRVAVMNNGARKGGTRQAWRIMRDAPGLQDLWQLHLAADSGPEFNSPEPYLANVDESTAHGLKVSAQADGSFAVTNARTGQTKRYPPRRR
jgi:competence protein ComEC